MSKSFQHLALLARNWNPSHSKWNEQIEEFTRSKDIKRIHGPSREETDSSQAEYTQTLNAVCAKNTRLNYRTSKRPGESGQNEKESGQPM
jgi:hypothetical protein